MDAVVMAGGMGRRLGKDEKPLTMILNRPMIHYVLSALIGSKNINHIFVAISPGVKKTIQWLLDFIKEHDNASIGMIQTPGKGFVNDMVLAVEKAGITGRVLIIMADLPLVTPELIDRIIQKYGEVNTQALSVHMRLDVCTRLGLRPDTVFHKNSGFIVPCGINILDADRIREEQEDFNLVLDDEELALNVNTQEDLAVCERYLKGKVCAVI
ncbi:GTP:adenosylcobinamide-phosphate guanylyltransferase [Candidatus Methanoperedens nitroreducens]|uniref:GTP:adenosylcobinamide-phosphate guanylyltransferase n=1 Tax=Candidatus Methanoperedens nitratireducens TaxID=1392998 RepID=A0A062VB70_9EURY|nr:NTP transferase domain-containing protein [Candidatus Methanoperedens nitroreducens]KCZ72565.1 GTP:adenosylcobinamide-phosphate guanylyltransferase [Candidatus Methanoperedens nitroreducens]MDJ1423503.1 NTP transferase domain-containing protein [Candidatus Methanoperedens sp.]